MIEQSAVGPFCSWVDAEAKRHDWKVGAVCVDFMTDSTHSRMEQVCEQKSCAIFSHMMWKRCGEMKGGGRERGREGGVCVRERE